MPALMLLQSLGEAVVARGLKGLMGFVPFGEQVYEIAKGTLDVYRRLQREAQMAIDAEEMLKATMEEVKSEAKRIANEIGREQNLTPEELIQLESYLTQAPIAARQSLRRPQDPSGTTIPISFDLKDPAQLASIFPKRAPLFQIGQQVPHSPSYVFSEILGSGGFGEVWLAKHNFLDQRRAFKFCLDAQARERLLRHEGEVVKRVMSVSKSVQNNEHGIVPLVDAYLEGETPWLAYEYVDGGDLASLVREKATLSPATRSRFFLRLLVDLAEVVGKLHRLPQPIIHRDLKPANILFQNNGESWVIRVTDFGISHVTAQQGLQQATVSTPSMNLGNTYRSAHTPIYASPQQKKGEKPNVLDDVFALGVIGYQLLLGDLTAERPSGKWRKNFLVHELPEQVFDILESCFDDDPTERPDDASHLADKLKKIVGTPSISKPDTQQMPLPNVPQSVELTTDKTLTPKTIPPLPKLKWYKVLVGKLRTPKRLVRSKPALLILVVVSLGLLLTLLYTSSRRSSYDLGFSYTKPPVPSSYDLYLKGYNAEFGKEGVQQNYGDALKFYRQSADMGNTSAMWSLGRLYENGNGSKRDYAEAFLWYRKAADGGDKDAMNSIGILYYEAKGFTKDTAQALNWYQKAADLGSGSAMHNIGLIYEFGDGIPKDTNTARKWYEKAANAGNEAAKERLKSLK